MKEKKLFEQSSVKELSTTRIKTKSPFMDLFPVDEKKVDVIAEHMKVNGFDQSQPVIVWDAGKGPGRHELIVVDGHTRLQAAQKIDLRVVPVAVVKFRNEDEAFAYSCHAQRDRRNLTDPELFQFIEAVDQVKQRGGDHRSEKSKASSDAIEKGKSSKETAAIVGTSARKVEKVRRILSKGDATTKQAVLDGTKTINKANQEITGASPVVGAEPKTATYVRGYFLCPYCGKKNFEDEIKLIRTPDAEPPPTLQ